MIARRRYKTSGDGMGRLVAVVMLLLCMIAPAMAAEVNRPVRETTITVSGMLCSSCAKAVEQALVRLSGVVEAKGEVSDDRVRVKYDASRVSPQRMVEAIRQAGYRARWPEEQPHR